MSDLTKIKNAHVFKGRGYTDDSHPDSGSLILMNNGQAFFGGALYQRQNDFSWEKTVEEPEAPKVTVPGLAAYTAGDRVRVLSDIYADTRNIVPVGSEGTVRDVSSHYVNVDIDNHPDSGTWPFLPDEVELLPPIPKFKVGDKIVVQKHQWNIGYGAVSGPVIGAVVNVSTSEGVPSYAVQHANKWGVTTTIWTDRAEADNLVAAPVFKYAVGDRVTVTDYFTQGEPQQGTVVGVTPFYRGEDGGGMHDFPYMVKVDDKTNPTGRPGWATSEKHLSDPAPEPTHTHPEGLYQHPDTPGYKVYVQHEDEPGRYRITYLSDEPTEGRPSVNRDMDDRIVSYYTLVTPA